MSDHIEKCVIIYEESIFENFQFCVEPVYRRKEAKISPP